MSNSDSRSPHRSGDGRCLCGSIHISVNNLSSSLEVCHCGICRKWAGGPLFAINCGSQVTFEGEANIAIFNSSEWAERGFCKQCGTHLFYRLKQNNQFFIPAGLFDQPVDFVFDHQVFIDAKPSYYEFANQTHMLTEAEIFAQFAPQPESSPSP